MDQKQINWQKEMLKEDIELTEKLKRKFEKENSVRLIKAKKATT